MNNLTKQFRKALMDLYKVEIQPDPFWNKLLGDKMQFVILQELISENRFKTDLVDLVLQRMEEDKFQLGMKAHDFFVSCADEIFISNLKSNNGPDNEELHSKMKRLHPLWGKSYMSV